MNKLLLVLLFWIGAHLSYGQSSTYINENFDINAGVPVTWYGDVTFGPNAVVYIEDGATAIFYGKNMTVEPGATFIALPSNSQTGTGVFIFRGNNPLHANYPLQQTLNGGYTSGIHPTLPNIEIDNAAGLSLTGNSRISNNVKFTAGHLYLNNFNLVLDNDATFSGHDVTKHVVTNGTGVIVKENLANGSSFIFPVSIAGLDYTSATVLNQAVSRNINVQVKDYSTSAATETSFATRGIDRTWQISSSIAGAANVVLQHNSATNANGTGTNESAFNNNLSFVSQQLSTGVWSSSCSGNDGGSPISITTGSNLVLPATADATAYFTKQSVNCADLFVTKTVNSVSPLVGSTVTFTITARNNGVVDATGVTVNELLPNGYSYISSTVSVGTYNNLTGIWTVGNLANGASATLTVTASINGSGSYANTATISGAQTDPDPINNSATVTPVPGALQANLGVTKTTSSMAPVIGTNVEFIIAISNQGPNNATGVRVTEQLPSGYSFVSSVQTVGAYNSSTGIWDVGNLANGATATLTVTAVVLATGSYANTANITGNEIDPVLGNNTSTVTPIPNAAQVNLAITKTATMGGIHIGQEFEYVLTVRNLSAYLATGVIATDVLPAELGYVLANNSYGTVTHNNGTNTVSWNIGNLAAGASVEITIRVKALKAGLIRNTATVTSTETDTDLTNNSATHNKELLGLQIPNVITPDGDGRNDTFKVPGIEAYPENTLMIYNRWGNEVWKSTGMTYRNEWDGRGLNGGTYYYVLRLKTAASSWQTLTGWVTLLRD